MLWSLVTCTISSGSLSEEVLVSDRRQLPMSLDTEDTLCMMLMTMMTMIMEFTMMVELITMTMMTKNT